MKGLPLAYAKDMQEDKEALFDVYDTLMLVIKIARELIDRSKIKKEKMLQALSKGYPTATDLADWLVRVLGIPFRDAHHATGKLVGLAEKKGCSLADLSLEEMRRVENDITEDIYSVLTNEASAASRISFGGTSPDCVLEAIAKAKERYL